MMQTSCATNGRYSQNPSPPPYGHVPHSSSPQANSSNSPQSSGNQQVQNDARLTPRQEPQGEESKLPETQCVSLSQHQGYSKRHPMTVEENTNVADDKPVSTSSNSKRHKPQSNSLPVQSSQCIQHAVKPQQSRSLDSSNSSQIDKIYTVSLPHYAHPPAYAVPVMSSHNVGSTVNSQQAVAINNSNNLVTAYIQGKSEYLPPPPEYPGIKEDVRRSYEVLDRLSSKSQHTGASLSQSSSQPELSKSLSSVVIGQQQQQVLSSTSNSSQSGLYNAPQPSIVPQSANSDQQQDFAAVATRASQMVEILSEENKSLRNELEGYYKKAVRLQKIEFELQKVHEAHDNLVKSSVKKEMLEKAIRMRQELDIKQLEEYSRQNHERARGFEEKLADQASMLNDLSKLIGQHEETISQLNKLTLEQRETIGSRQNMVQGLKKELDSEKSRSKLLEEELDAYKINTTATLEEESEVKMAALTQSTKDSERIIQEAQAEKIKYMDEAHQAYKRMAHLEARVKTLEALCAEREAVVRVLQRRQRSNLSGRGQTSPQLPSASQHTRRISEPSSGQTPTASRLSTDNIEATTDQSDDSLQTQTWQV